MGNGLTGTTATGAVGGGTEAGATRVTIANDSTGVVSVDDNSGSLTVDNTILSVTGGGSEATAQRVTIANDSTGVVSVDDNGGSLTTDSPTTGIEGTAAIFKLLTWESGPGSGTDMITDYTASVNSVFIYQVPNGKVAYISWFNILIQDGNITPDKFGGISALSNGCLVKLVSSADAEVIDFCDGVAITTNSRFALLAGADIVPVAGTAVDVMPIRWTVAKAFAGRPLKMVDQQKFQWTNRDDMTGLSEFRVMVQGWIEDE